MSYDASQLAASELYQVRFLIGDTNTAAHVLADAEIQWLLTQEANVYMAAAAACDAIIAKMNAATSSTGAIIRKRIGQTDISYANGKTAGDYAAIQRTLRGRGRSHQTVFAGGISEADKLMRAQDTDRPRTNRIETGRFNDPALGSGAINPALGDE